MAHTPKKALRLPVSYRRARAQDFVPLSHLVRESWPVDMRDQVDDILKDALANPDSTAIFACFLNNDAIGYAQVCIRNEYVEGATNYPIAYLEALYIKEGFRDVGIGQRLIEMVTMYVNAMGIEELAADCPSNDLHQFELFLRSGFEEISQVTHFVKSIPMATRRS